MQRLPLGKYLGFKYEICGCSKQGDADCAASIFLWGFFLMLQSAAKSFTTLGVLRALAGAAEACSDPSFILITSMVCPTMEDRPLVVADDRTVVHTK